MSTGLRARAVDVLLVVAIIAAGALPRHRMDGTAGALFTIALVLPLFVRRRWPLEVFAAISAVAFAQWVADVRAFGDAALLVALYTVAATQPARRLAAAAAVLLVGIVLASARWAPQRPEYAFIALTGLATAAAVIGMNRRNRRMLVESLRERADRLEQERDQQGRLAAAAERSRIAREMHDIVAHNLSVMIALADGAAYAVAHSPERAEEAMHNASRTGRHALTEMRRLLGILRDERDASVLSPQPGLREIEALVDQVRAPGRTVTFSVEGAADEPLPPGLQLAAYRIVQEALTNTLKHAGPDAAAHVRLGLEPNALTVEVRDSGSPERTRSAEQGTQEGGGLRGMRERAAVYGGVVVAGPTADGGWLVTTKLLAMAEAVA